ncbi:hypothetical protein B0T10DRAFT_539210 [Thelonectria olida]|uniref:Zn(2)-C6 fungal-type domain-containing protein n=1 Tax=Thelonectria olida TaxID=1576542 RepID=A0A9P8W240_9HYPO|nr:hypothetical protein B0T10DRAFT_539210 [Thelonectria olida]
MEQARLRQGHRKSRNGCAVCKRRHIKCDERRPKCGNCNISDRPCHYVAPKKAKAGANKYEKELTTSAWLQTAANSTETPSPASPDLHLVESDDLFTFEHLNLLNHFQVNMVELMMVTDQLKPVANIYITSAFKTPYLMNQLLALSALHIRTITPGLSDWYTQTATHLQHRALRGFNNALHDTSDSNATSQFLFSSLLALHYLAETVVDVPDQDFPSILRHILEYLRLQRGARIMGDRAWPTFSTSMLQESLVAAINTEPEVEHKPPDSCSLISAMLQTSELNRESLIACEDAREALGFARRRLRDMGVHALIAWPNLIPPRFLTLLEKQIPEALVILAHFAVLLHDYRAFWCFGRMGEKLVNGIETLLVTYWTTWLPRLDVETRVDPELARARDVS